MLRTLGTIRRFASAAAIVTAGMGLLWLHWLADKREARDAQ